jgi:MYXO-CTERM domain-containing protein
MRLRVARWLTRWLRARGWRRLPMLLKLPWWSWLALLLILVMLPICALNVAVAWVGHSSVFPLSPFFLGYKIDALKAYAWHRPRCVFFADQPISAPLLARAEKEQNLPCGLMGAIVKVESGGAPHRISRAGAMGPMQLIPPTARALGVSDPFDPEQSVEGAARYLHTQFARFHSIRLAAAAYNAGPGAIVGRRVPHNGQTEIYVDRVMRALAFERRARCAPPRRSAPVSRSRRQQLGVVAGGADEAAASDGGADGSDTSAPGGGCGCGVSDGAPGAAPLLLGIGFVLAAGSRRRKRNLLDPGVATEGEPALDAGAGLLPLVK